MRNFRRIQLLSLVAVAVPALSAPPGYRLAKEKDATYIKDILEENEVVRFRVLRPTPVFATKEATTRIGALLAERQVELEAFSQFAVRVRGMGEHGILVGWVNPRDLEPPAPDALETLRKIAERREQVAEWIRKKMVAMGMSPSEVAESKGEPTRRESVQTAGGRQEAWEYIDYEIIPRYETLRDPMTGNLYRRFAYNEKVEKGKTRVEFTDGVVTRVLESEEHQRRGNAAVVPAPIFCPWP